MVEEFYGYFVERWQVDFGDKFLEVLARTVKIEKREGGEGGSTFSSTRSTCHSARGWLWLWWARSGGVKADRKRLEVNEGGQSIDEVEW